MAFLQHGVEFHMDETGEATVKQIAHDVWEVTLGAGLPTERITLNDVFWLDSHSAGTIAVSTDVKALLSKARCVQALIEWLAAQGKMIGYGVVDKR